MRQAFREDIHYCSGLKAFLMVKNSMDDYSWERLNFLLDIYPDSIIEFSVLDKPLGSHYSNTIIWEVRNY